MSRRPRVLLALPVAPQSGWARPMMEGALDVAEREGWDLDIGAVQHLADKLAADPPEGVILHAARDNLREMPLPPGLPLVNLSNRDPDPRFPGVHNDEGEIGRLAARFFLDRGYDRFATFGHDSHAYSRERGAAFGAMVAGQGHPCPRTSSARELIALARSGTDRTRRITPLAVLCSSDLRAIDALVEARKAQLEIPRDLAILGVDNDAILTRLHRPNLSSVITDNRRIGEEGAHLLSRLMRGEAPPDTPILIPPLGIEERQSTSPVAARDPRVDALVAWSRTHLERGIDVGDLVAHSRIPRRSLERLFREDLGMTPAAMLRRVRLHRAAELLVRTDLPLARIAEACGFSDPAAFTHAFRRQAGVVPSRYRDDRATR